MAPTALRLGPFRTGKGCVHKPSTLLAQGDTSAAAGAFGAAIGFYKNGRQLTQGSPGSAGKAVEVRRIRRCAFHSVWRFRRNQHYRSRLTDAPEISIVRSPHELLSGCDQAPLWGQRPKSLRLCLGMITSELEKVQPVRLPSTLGLGTGLVAEDEVPRQPAWNHAVVG